MASEFKRVAVSGVMRRRILLRDNMTCQYCSTTTADVYEVDHVVPVALGGPSLAHNLTTACGRCNSVKRDSAWVPLNLNVITADCPEWRVRILRVADSQYPWLNFSIGAQPIDNGITDIPRTMRRLAIQHKCTPWDIITLALCDFIDAYDLDDAAAMAKLEQRLQEWISPHDEPEPDYEDALQGYAA
jgi:hypothetical protein